MARNSGITDYDIYRSKIIGNYNLILDRYPNDKIMQLHLGYMISGMEQFISLLIKDKESLERFKKEVKA